MTTTEDHTRYSFGGDEWVVVQLAEAMSLQANLKAQVITRKVAEEKIDGILEICPSNASYMLRIDPDVIHPQAVVDRLRELENSLGDGQDLPLPTRIVDIPVLIQDEWTHETVLRFRDRHQSPNQTDLEFAAELNGFADVGSFVTAVLGAPFIVSMVGFVPSVPWGYQLVSQDRQIEVPKYVRPRTYTPERAFGWGGAFSVIYPVAGAGGYQLFGRCPAPIVDAAQRLPDFKDSYAFPRLGDIFNYRRVERPEYDEVRDAVEKGIFKYHIKEVEFVPREWFADPDSTVERLGQVLYGA